MPTQAVRFDFAFAPAYRLAALPFVITPGRCHVRLDDVDLEVRFGLWRLITTRANIAGAEITGGFRFWRAAGPPRLSLVDRGVSFATNGEEAVCLRFADPVAALDPTGRLRHPAATLTLADPQTFLNVLALT